MIMIMNFRCQTTTLGENKFNCFDVMSQRKYNIINMFVRSAFRSHRRSIATKVMAKKVSRGYKLLEEPCDGCEMPLMEIKGRVECKVCPAIMKWVRRQQERQFCMEIEARDVQESNERVVEERCGHEEEIHYQVDNRDECGNAETAEEFEREDFVSEELANSRNASDSPKMHKDVIASQESNTNEDFHLQMRGESVISQERSEQNEEEKKQGRFLSKSQSNDSDNDFESKKYIEERARQIIMDARKTGAWSFESTPSFNEPSLKSAVVSWGDSKMHTRNNTDHLDDSESREQLEERAERIIYETRQKLNISCDSAASVESRNERRMHGINNSMDKSEQSYDSKSRKETLERAEDIIIESRKKLQMGNDVTAAVDFMLSPRSKVRHAQVSLKVFQKSFIRLDVPLAILIDQPLVKD